MLAAALVVFREVLEAALIVTIIMAATRGMPGRNRWVALGIISGIVGAGLVAALTTTIASLFQGTGQEIVNATILFAAVFLIGWHVIWMNSHGRRMAAEMRMLGNQLAQGQKHLSILALVVGLAVMREGSEIVLILQGLWTSGATFTMMGGAAFGLTAGVIAGALMYAGFLVLSLQRVFALTNGLLVLIAAGMAARGANFLAQAGLISSLDSRVWDTSFFLSDQSIIGQVFAALVGYIARPNGIEILFYTATILIISVLIIRTHKHHAHGLIKNLPVVLLAVSIFGLMPEKAHAGEEVFSPYVTLGEWEFEQEGVVSYDRNPANNGAQDFENSIGYSPTAFWHAELESEFSRDPGPDQDLRYQSINWLNTLALAEPGEFWFDPAAYFEADFARSGLPNTVISGLIGAKLIGPVLDTINLFGYKEYGPGATPFGVQYANQAKYRLAPWLEPGFELYGDTLGRAAFDNQLLQTGPGVFGQIFGFADGQEFKYEVAFLFGATPASPDQALRWKLEYEFF